MSIVGEISEASDCGRFSEKSFTMHSLDCVHSLHTIQGSKLETQSKIDLIILEVPIVLLNFPLETYSLKIYN